MQAHLDGTADWKPQDCALAFHSNLRGERKGVILGVVEFKRWSSPPFRYAFAFGVVVVLLFLLYYLQNVLLLCLAGLLLGLLLDAIARIGMRFLKLPRNA